MRGTDYVVKRVLFAIGTVFVAVTLNFVLFRSLSGDAVSALRCRQCSQEFKDSQRRELGLDKSKWQQYEIYLRGLAQGDMGRSLRSEEPVTSLLWPAIKTTVPMVALGTLFAMVFGIATGVIAAWRRGTAADKTSLWGGLAFYSMPPQWLGLVIVLFIADRIGLPTSGVKDPTLGILSNPGTIEVLVDRLKHMLLPALTLGLVVFGEYTLIVRSAMLETLGEDYVLTSRAKGLSNWATVWKHGFRNAMLPVITLVALSLGFIIGGAITVEYVFSYPGIGLLIVEAIDQRDYPVLYFKLDPRVTE